MAIASRISTGLLPDGAGAFVRKRLAEFAGFALVAAGALLAAALATFSPGDPSLSNANDLRPANLLGLPGAIAADLMLQTLGIAAALLPVSLAAWGWRLMRARNLPLWWLRIVLLPVCVLLAAMALSTWGAPSG